MTYLGLTQPTAEWMLGKKEWLRALFTDLPALLRNAQLQHAVLPAGPLRLAMSTEGRVLALWNPDYLSNTGAEPWGFVRLSNPVGLLVEASGEEVLERCVYVINQRLQGLLLDDRLIHKSVGDVHTCLAGRGAQTRQLSIGYAETELNLASGRYRSIMCVGPERDRSILEKVAEREIKELPILTALANGLVSGGVLRPPLEGLPSALRAQASSRRVERENELPITVVPALTGTGINQRQAYETLSWSFSQWTDQRSSLTREQRSILDGDILLSQPLRLIGAAGSGKTLLMQLLAMRRLHAALDAGQSLRVLYVVHNSAMMETIWARFVTLGAESFLDCSTPQILEIRTLFEYSRELLDVEDRFVIDPDAQATKVFQQECVAEAMRDVFLIKEDELRDPKAAPLLSLVTKLDALLSVFAELVVTEIGVAIKGHGFESDRARYVGSERQLSRLHGAMNSLERNAIFDIFERYHRRMFEELEILDTDDLALSLLGRMRTPIWEMKRRRLGYDFVFVDETQLFSENERRLFPLLTRGDRNYVPVALALDQAQDTRGASSAGLGSLGIKAIADQKLTAVQRSTAAILRLAFNVIQHTTDLFGPDFPDFTGAVNAVIDDEHPSASPPLIVVPVQGASLGKAVLRQVQSLRRNNLRQIAIVVHAEELMHEVKERLQSANLNLTVMATRGQRIAPDHLATVLTTPSLVGGQEFDAVVSVGIEQGRVPPRVQGNEALAAALEQRALREIYVAFTRARYRLVIVNSAGSAMSSLLEDAFSAGLLKEQRDQ